MHREYRSQAGVSHLLVLVGVALTCSIAIAAWFWIAPQPVTSESVPDTATAPVSIPTVRTMPPAEGRQAMTGSSASADIEQRVQRLADASRRNSPDVSQFPAADADSNPWPEKQTEAQAPVVAPQPPTSSRNSDTVKEQVRIVVQEAGEQEVQPSAQEEIPPEELDAMLAAARAYLARDRLTTPAGANALESFQAVLTRDPANEQATRGLHDIVDKYVALARRVARKGRFDKAESFLQRAERVGVKADVLLAAREQVAEMRANQ